MQQAEEEANTINGNTRPVPGQKENILSKPLADGGVYEPINDRSFGRDEAFVEFNDSENEGLRHIRSRRLS